MDLSDNPGTRRGLEKDMVNAALIRAGIDWVFVVDSPGEYIDRSFPTASWWEKHEIQPGEYPVTFARSDWSECEPAEAYWLRCTVDSVVTESYFVNRLFTASSVDHTTGKREPRRLAGSTYAYLLGNDLSFWWSDPEPGGGWKKRPIGRCWAVAPCGDKFMTADDADAHRMTCGACAGAEEEQ